MLPATVMRSMAAETEPMGRKPTRRRVELSDGDRERLERIVSSPRNVHRHVWRARTVQELGAGCGLAETMRRTGISKLTVWRWHDQPLHHAGVIHIKGASYRLRDHADLIPEHIRPEHIRATAPPKSRKGQARNENRADA